MADDDNAGCLAIIVIPISFAGLYFLTEYRFSVDFEIGPVTIFSGFIIGGVSAFITVFAMLVILRPTMFIWQSITFERNLVVASILGLIALQYIVNYSLGSQTIMEDFTARFGNTIGGSAGGGYHYVYRSEAIAWRAAWLMGLNVAQILCLFTFIFACFNVRKGFEL